MNEDLCYKLNYLSRLLLSQVNQQLRDYGVTQGQLPVLCCLKDDEGQTQTELCRKIQVEQPTMAKTLWRMERDGLIYRAASERDRRQSRIYLAEQTRPTVEALQKMRDEVIASMTGGMSAAELQTFHRLLDMATQALESLEEDK
ncbi:MAG: MarR family transcriptional regulator [Desulfuromonadales bacterium]|nr:MarR family transcriptional regulator [Desulfuromonadales bacterium]MDW7758945.1 MarR family transcriptional regulator [Desulfuromonadales bacterium]